MRRSCRIRAAMTALPPSPLEKHLGNSKSGRELRTAYGPRYRFDDTLDRSEARSFRESVRSGKHPGQTSGFAPGFVQANFVALPKEHAFEFLRFALTNPKACPLLSVTQPGDPTVENVAAGADLRQDIPKYRVWRDGKLAEERADIREIWDAQKDMVGFLLGCSFSWENVLKEAGLCPRQIEEGKNVPMYRTVHPNYPVGPFTGELVVSMRPYQPDKVPEAADITSRYPGAHGGPVHWGDPSELGFSAEKLAVPDWGDAVTLKEGEVPVFWACGVTPQTAVEAAALPLVVTHAPGHMFICDVTDAELKINL